MKPSFWDGWTVPIGFGVVVSGLVSLLAVASGASSSQAGGIIASLVFAAFLCRLLDALHNKLVFARAPVCPFQDLQRKLPSFGYGLGYLPEQ